MERIKIDIDPEEILQELDLDDVIKFYTPYAICQELTSKEIIDHVDTDELLGEMEWEDIINFIQERT